MLVSKIHEMQWSNLDHTAVSLVADTDQGNNIIVHTPYDSTSIIWEIIQAYSQEDISEYVTLESQPIPTRTVENIPTSICSPWDNGTELPQEYIDLFKSKLRND